MASLRRYLILPEGGLRATTESVFNTVRPMGVGFESASDQPGPSFTVIDSLHESGVKLIESRTDNPDRIAAAMQGVTVVPEVFFDKAVAPRHTVSQVQPSAFSAPAVNVTIQVVDESGSGVSGALVVAFSNFAQRRGAQGKTDQDGKVKLRFGVPPTLFDRVYVYIEEGRYWSMLFTGVDALSAIQVQVSRIDLNTPDLLAILHADPADTDGDGVRVGIIDSGIELDHPNLKVAGGLNCVTGDGPPENYGPIGGGHGTHVAGIIAAHGVRPSGVRGIAPSAEIYSYRVFPAGDSGASNFDIVRAIEQGVADGCHLLNMSLGGGNPDLATQRAIRFAWNNGVVCIVANGNDGRSPVSFPASYHLSVAVSAYGKSGSCPPNTVSDQSTAPPADSTGKYSLAEFSNIGLETDFTGPGVGIVATWPGHTYAALDGTSMACPAVTGMAAKLLADNPQILAMPGDANRSTAILNLINRSAHLMGFGVEYEGSGSLS